MRRVLIAMAALGLVLAAMPSARLNAQAVAPVVPTPVPATNSRSNSDRSAYRAEFLVQLFLAGSAGDMDGAALRVELRYGRASRTGRVPGVSGLQTGLAAYPASVKQSIQCADAGLDGAETMHLVCVQLVVEPIRLR